MKLLFDSLDAFLVEMRDRKVEVVRISPALAIDQGRRPVVVPHLVSRVLVTAALDEVRARIGDGGHVAGIHVVEPDEDRLNDALEDGYRFVAFASEMLIFSHRLREVSSTLLRMR